MTIIKNLELYGLDPQCVANILQQKVQASATITPIPGTKDRVQVQIQGNQIHHLAKMLLGKSVLELGLNWLQQDTDFHSWALNIYLSSWLCCRRISATSEIYSRPWEGSKAWPEEIGEKSTGRMTQISLFIQVFCQQIKDHVQALFIQKWVLDVWDSPK